MGYEVEVKFRIDNLDEIERKVRRMAEFVIEKHEKDIYFNSPIRDFAETDEALRIRRDVEGVVLTYKGRKIDPETKTREEVKVRICPEYEENMIEVLQKLGFRKFAEVRKKRKIFRMQDVTFCIDSLEIGDFIEIEVESDDIEGAKKKIFEIVESLNLRRDDGIRKSYLELLIEKRQDSANC
jgi:adenylate cyclase class 2